ncbi:Sulfate-transporting ATPase [Handroanthus impetiginosus]|uniref:Sulfate-transporting ATPase n=1 Tax=Handroanthus impetiginosus TaxID=429701 RepID=A0A2G9GDQ9_9LAMI|nr:Sulfate-transporting ATPase [Handroanthus impetiginosus]
MVSLAVSISHTPLNISSGNNQSWRNTTGSNLLRSFSTLPFSSIDEETSTRNRRVSCACVAPPQDFTPAKFMGPHRIETSTYDKELGDESDVLIECRDVYKSFGEKHILRGVSFKIRHGEAVGIIGPSGTGKSTILKIMAGLLAPDKGEVLIRGRRRHGLISDEEISGLRIGLVFQSAALFDSLTVRENVGFLLYENSTMSEDQIAELVTETLAAVGLKGVEDRLPSELSGGMKKRVALARSIIFDTTKDSIEPEVLLYDEPTAGLDPIASTVVEDLIRSVHVKGEDALGKPGKIASYVVVTHQHSTIKRAVDRLLFLYEGKVVWQGMTHEFSSSTNPIVRQFASGNLDGPIRY